MCWYRGEFSIEATIVIGSQIETFKQDLDRLIGLGETKS